MTLADQDVSPPNLFCLNMRPRATQISGLQQGDPEFMTEANRKGVKRIGKRGKTNRESGKTNREGVKRIWKG